METPIEKKIRYAHKNAMNRCYNPKYKSFKDYGGRGIAVCEAWHNFQNFKKDVPLPSDMSLQLDRIETNKNYEPGNVQWSTPAFNMSNRRVYKKDGLPKGVYAHGKRFRAVITINKRTYEIGRFAKVCEAVSAFQEIFYSWHGYLPKGNNEIC